MVLVTFVITFMIRIVYEAFGYYAYTRQRAKGEYACEFTSAMEIICGCIVYFTFPIGLLCILHYKNAKPVKAMTTENGASDGAVPHSTDLASRDKYDEHFSTNASEIETKYQPRRTDESSYQNFDNLRSTDLEKRDALLIRTEASGFSLGSKKFKLSTSTPPGESIHTNLLSSSARHKTGSDASKSQEMSKTYIKNDQSSIESD